MENLFTDPPLAIRADLLSALHTSWAELGEVGAWLDAGERIAVAAAARQAWDCPLCQRRKEALSPYTITGSHYATSALPDSWVEVIHRVVTDSGRLSEAWLKEVLAGDIVEDEFVEIVSVAVIAVTIDTFTAAIGRAALALPTAKPGEPLRQPEPSAKPGPGWISTIAPEDAGPDFADFYAGGSDFYIRRALTLVPAEVRRFFALMNTLYMPDPRVHEFDGLDRSIVRAQAEYLAARASARLNCYY